MSFEIGNTIGTYKIVAAIGSGGMGEVFEVEHLVTRRAEALKLVANESSTTPEQAQRFLREIQLQARLSHPNIAAVHNAFWENGQLIMIMELIPGCSLRGLLERGRLPLSVALDYASQALAALDYAHRFGVVHRDVSPSNMIVGEDGTLKLMDFGLAKSSTDLRLTQSGAMVGSLYYTPPEQVRGQAKIDARADIYSMGSVLFEMATGGKLFESENPFTLMLAHVEQPPRRPSEVDPSLPPGLDEIILKALEKDPEKRFQSAELFRCALDSVKDPCLPWHNNPHAWERRMESDAPAALTRQLSDPSPPAHDAGSRLHSPYLKIAAAVVFAFIFTYLWNSAFLPANGAGWRVRRASQMDPADLPVTWPSQLIPVPELTYVSAQAKPSGRPHAQRAASVTEDKTRGRKNPLLRAMGRVIHPIRHDEPSN